MEQRLDYRPYAALHCIVETKRVFDEQDLDTFQPTHRRLDQATRSKIQR